MLQVKKQSSLRRTCDLNEGQGHRTGNGHIDLYSYYLHSKQDLEFLNGFGNNQTFILFMFKICVTLNQGQGQYN